MLILFLIVIIDWYNMGKKVKIINDDPILSKNFKYEKRKKTK